MKLTYLIIITLLLGSCQQKCYKYLIVEQVELTEFTPSTTGKYKLTLRDDFSAMGYNVAFYTDSVYTAGDTIKLTK